MLRQIASEDLRDLALAWIAKMTLKDGSYPYDSYPNPGTVVTFQFGVLNSC